MKQKFLDLEVEEVQLEAQIFGNEERIMQIEDAKAALDSTDKVSKDNLMKESNECKKAMNENKCRMKIIQLFKKKLVEDIEGLSEEKKLAEAILDDQENDEQHLSDEESFGTPKGSHQKTAEWVDKTNQDVVNEDNKSVKSDELLAGFPNIPISHEAHDDAASATSDVLRQRLEKPRNPGCEFNGNPDPLNIKEDPNGKGELPKNSVMVEPMTQALHALTQILVSQQVAASSQRSNSTDKFLARQSHSKDLPTFGGKPEEWPAFISDFRRTTELCGFSDAENVSRLRKCLKGEALKSVQCLLIAPDSLKKVMELDHIIEALIGKVRKTVSVREDKADTWIEFGTAVTNLIATIKALERTDHLQNPTLLLELENKLSMVLKIQWKEWLFANTQRKKDLEHFSQWIEHKTEIVYSISPPDIKEDRKEWQGKSRKPWETRPKNEERVFAADVNSTEKSSASKGACYICDGHGHRAYKCDKFIKMDVDVRRKLMSDKRLCFNCFDPKHSSKDCHRKSVCGIDECKAKHNSLLHVDRREPGPVEHVHSTNSTDKNGNGSTIEHRGILGVLKVKLTGPAGEQEVYALVDPGSSTCLIDDDVSKQLGLNGKEVSICIKGVNFKGEPEKSQMVSLGISGCYPFAKEHQLKFVKTLRGLDIGPLTLNMKDLAKKFPAFQGIPLNSYNNVKPKILLGSDYSYLTEALKIVAGKPSEPRVYKSRLGWYVGGALERNRVDHDITYHVCNVMEHPLDSTDKDAALHDLVKASFSTENFGVKISNQQPRSREDIRALDIMEKTTRRIESGDRFETGLLWKDDKIELPESYGNARCRLKCQERKMDRDTEFADLYCKKMEEYEEKGFIKKLMDYSTEQSTDKRTWYLPHFGVTNPNKPGKLRLVFDAAAESHGMSLNKALVQGPDLNNSIVSVLLKFRQYEYAFVGDVKDMFHRVLIRPEDRHSQRFLWRGMSRDREPDVYEMQAMIFGSACSPSSAQFVKNKNSTEHSTENSEAAKAIINKFYVDDYLDSRPTVEESKQIIHDVVEIQRKASFEVCNWTSNSAEVMESIPLNLRATDYRSLEFGKDDMPTGRILGLWWNQQDDVLTFRRNFHKVPLDILNGKRPTKREVLKLVMSIYDPLGLIAHYVIQGKVLLQDIWRSGIGFDDTLTESTNNKWKQFIDQLENLTKVEIPRCYSKLIPRAENIQLHLFCDASEQAFSAVAYLRVSSTENSTDIVEVNIVIGKTRVAPMKTLSIPRLELQAAVMAARMAKTLKEELEVSINETFYWSDSSVVLCQLRNNERRFKTFVSHRVGEILESTDPTEWRWVPTGENPADDATRDSTDADLNPTSRWFNGPGFLKLPMEEWPVESRKKTLADMSPEELEIKIPRDDLYLVDDFSTEKDSVEIFVENYDRLAELILDTVHAFRKVNSMNTDGDMTVDEWNQSMAYWVRRSQRESFPEDLKRLHGGRTLSSKSRLRQLSPILKEGFLKMRSRLGNAEDSTGNLQYPLILDPKHAFTELLVDDVHRQCGHQGKQTVANELRKKYWIISLGAAVKKAFWNCDHCKRARAKPCPPEMGDLPRARLESYIQPFKNTGLDYFGPFNVVIGRRHEKRWGALFTCLSTRAVHLEIAGDLSTDSCILAITRFARRRGAPENIYSDNGTNFRGADNELREILKQLDSTGIQRKFSSQGIRWHFNPPAAPHMGGVWERLVASVKKVLKGLLWEKAMREEVVHTLFTEAEWILNSRPLTDVSVDLNDPLPLTPNHFLIGWRSGVNGKFNGNSPVGSLPFGSMDDGDILGRVQWRKAQRLADQFWARWVKEYLPSLAKRTKWNKPQKPVAVGDVVIVADDQAPKNEWMKGHIANVFPGKDGVVRVADVKTEDGRVFKRPVTKICVLDLQSTDNSISTEK